MKKTLILGFIIGTLLLTGLVYAWSVSATTTWNGSSWNNATSSSHTGGTNATIYLAVLATSCQTTLTHARIATAYRVSDGNDMAISQCPSPELSCCIVHSFNSGTGQSYYTVAEDNIRESDCGPVTAKLNSNNTDCPPE